MALTTIVTERIAPRMRGYLATWLVEIRAGVYVGNLSKRKREELWGALRESTGDGSCVMVWATNTEARYDFWMTGENRRTVQDFDGVKLVGLGDYRS